MPSVLLPSMSGLQNFGLVGVGDVGFLVVKDVVGNRGIFVRIKWIDGLVVVGFIGTIWWWFKVTEGHTDGNLLSGN